MLQKLLLNLIKSDKGIQFTDFNGVELEQKITGEALDSVINTVNITPKSVKSCNVYRCKNEIIL